MKKSLMVSVLILTNIICFSQSFKRQGLDSLFQALEKNNKFMGSIAVSQNGRLLYSNTIGYADVENSKKADFKTKYRIGSISKMFTAVLILKAVEENQLTLNQTLDKYYPEIENSTKITIENLLNHKSGIHNFTDDKSYSSYNTQPKSEQQIIEIIAKGKSNFEPGSKVAYSNSNYIVLSYILEKIYKNKFATILHAKIIKPLRLKDTYFGSTIQIENEESYSYHFVNKWDKATETDMSIPMGAGGIVSNAADLTVFIEQLFNGKIISQKFLSVMKTINEYHGIGIGMGIIAFTHFEKKSYGHNGSIDDFKSLLNYFPEEKLTIAVTSNGSIYPIENVIFCAMNSYFNTPFTMPTFNYVDLKPAVLDLYVGQYSSQQIPLKVVITKNENKLVGQIKGQSDFPLEAITENIFKFEKAELVIEFEAAKKQMILKQGGKEFLFTKE